MVCLVICWLCYLLFADFRWLLGILWYWLRWLFWCGFVCFWLAVLSDGLLALLICWWLVTSCEVLGIEACRILLSAWVVELVVYLGWFACYVGLWVIAVFRCFGCPMVCVYIWLLLCLYLECCFAYGYCVYWFVPVYMGLQFAVCGVLVCCLVFCVSLLVVRFA